MAWATLDYDLADGRVRRVCAAGARRQKWKFRPQSEERWNERNAAHS